MSGPRTSPDPASRRIGQLVRLLSSDQIGEAGAAAQALTRSLQTAGVDIHALAELAEKQLRLPLLPDDRRQGAAATPPTTSARRPAPPLSIGERIICDEAQGVFRPCRCGGIIFNVMSGTGPHLAQMRCEGCGCGGRWLGHAHIATGK